MSHAATPSSGLPLGNLLDSDREDYYVRKDNGPVMKANFLSSNPASSDVAAI